MREPSDLLRADEFTSLMFELDSVTGTAPSEAVTERVRSQVALLVDKPDGITVRHGETLPASEPDHAWTDQELRKLARKTEDTDDVPAQARVHVLTVDGRAARDDREFFTLGKALGARTIVLFDETIQRACAAGLLKAVPVSQFCEESESLIWLHEFGHLLGLVGHIPMVEDHRDPDHPDHDRNPECLMHWLFHHSSGVDKLRTRFNAGELAPIGFDRQCLDDLRAVRDAP